MEVLISYVAALAASALLGLIKSTVNFVDPKVTAFIKPFQPVVVALLAVGLPLLCTAIGIVEVPVADVVAQAPLATIVAVTAREVLKRLRNIWIP